MIQWKGQTMGRRAVDHQREEIPRWHWKGHPGLDHWVEVLAMLVLCREERVEACLVEAMHH